MGAPDSILNHYLPRLWPRCSQSGVTKSSEMNLHAEFFLTKLMTCSQRNTQHIPPISLRTSPSFTQIHQVHSLTTPRTRPLPNPLSKLPPLLLHQRVSPKQPPKQPKPEKKKGKKEKKKKEKTYPDISKPPPTTLQNPIRIPPSPPHLPLPVLPPPGRPAIPLQSIRIPPGAFDPSRPLTPLDGSELRGGEHGGGEEDRGGEEGFEDDVGGEAGGGGGVG